MNEKLKFVWCCAFIDCDGCIRLAKSGNYKGKQYFIPTVSVGQNDRAPLEILKETLGVGEIYFDKSQSKNSPNTSWKYIVSGRKNYHLYQKILPFLIVKQKKMERIIKYCEEGI